MRNFGRPADEVGEQWRPGNYSDLDDPQRIFQADTYFCFFGFNESFKGIGSIEEFKKNYRDYLDRIANESANDVTGKKVRFILVSPIAFEDADDPLARKQVNSMRTYELMLTRLMRLVLIQNGQC